MNASSESGLCAMRTVVVAAAVVMARGGYQQGAGRGNDSALDGVLWGGPPQRRLWENPHEADE